VSNFPGLTARFLFRTIQLLDSFNSGRRLRTKDARVLGCLGAADRPGPKAQGETEMLLFKADITAIFEPEGRHRCHHRSKNYFA
jgi:hypothetical protein